MKKLIGLILMAGILYYVYMLYLKQQREEAAAAAVSEQKRKAKEAQEMAILAQFANLGK